MDGFYFVIFYVFVFYNINLEMISKNRFLMFIVVFEDNFLRIFF